MATLGNSTNIGSIQLKESASPGTPSSGYGRLYQDTSNNLRFIDDTGTNLNLSAPTVLGAVTTGVWNGTTIGGAYGGTGLTTFGAAGRIPYASSTTVLTTASTFTLSGSDKILTLNATASSHGSTRSVLQVGAAGVFQYGTDGPITAMTFNGYWNGSADIYIANGYSGLIQVNGANGRIETATAASGTAAGTITYTSGPYVANLGTSWTTASDARLKTNVQPYTVLDKLAGYRAVEFDWIGATRAHPHDIGVIAQELAPIFPEAVNTGPVWGVEYDKLAALALQGVKELLARVEALEARG